MHDLRSARHWQLFRDVLLGSVVVFALVRAAPATPVDWAQRDRELLARIAEINAKTGARQISVEDLQARLGTGEKIVLLDVREPQENAVSALPGARLAPPKTLRTMSLADIPADATVVTYCTVGYRGGLAAVLLEGRLGRPVYSLEGGILQWYNQGGKVVDPTGRPVSRIDAVEEPWTSYVHPRRGAR